MKTQKFQVKRLLAGALGASLLALTLTACDSTAAVNGPGESQLPTIGVIQYAVHASLDNCYTGLLQGLEEAGYKDGETCKIDFKNAQGNVATADQIAGTMVAKNYDMIVGIATPAAMSASGAAKGKMPVIFCAVSDPMAENAKLVQSLEKTGVNCTGSSDRLNLEGQLKMIRAFQPDAKKIGILYNIAEANSASNLAEIKKIAPSYGFEIVEKGVQSAADIPAAAAVLTSQVDCINNFTDNLVVDNLPVVLETANAKKIPVYGSEIEQVSRGCLASESLDYVALGKETGLLAARVLKGEKAADTAVVLVKDSFPVYNPDVAASLGLTLPDAYASAQKVTTAA